MAMGIWQVTGDNKVTCHTYFTGQRDSLYFCYQYGHCRNLHVDLMEVMRVTITHNPLFYLILCVVAWVKVGIWQWLLSGVQQEDSQPV